LYQTLRMVPAQVFSISGEFIVNLIVGLMTLFWFSIPFIDRRAARGVRSRLFTAIGILLMGYMALTIGLAYLT